MRDITPDQLKEILKAHRKWVESEGKEGVRACLSDVSYADLSGAYLIWADLCKADLRNAYLSHADLTRANLSHAKLSGAKLGHVKLSDASLIYADISWAKLGDAKLNGADLGHADLSGSDLNNANLKDSDLTSADLEDADLTGADISGANIFHIKTHGWKIEGIKCTHVYNCPRNGSEEDREKSRINFKKGEFEAKYKVMPTIELVLSGRFRRQDYYKIDHIINEVGNKYGANLEVSGLKKEFGGMSVTLESKSDKEIEEMGRMIVREYKNRELDNKLIVTLRDENIEGAEPDKPEVHHHYHHVVQKFDFGHLLGATVTAPSIGTINIIGGDVKGDAIAIGQGAKATTIINNYASNKEEIDNTLEEFKKVVSDEVRQQVDALTEALKEKDEEKATGAWGKIKKVFKAIDKTVKTGEKAAKLSERAIDLYHKLEGVF